MEDGPEYESYDLEIALKLVENPAISGARWERELFYKIREELGPEDWQNLPALIREYRVEAHRQKERAEEERREAARRREEKRKQEQQRAAEERLEKERQLQREREERTRREIERQTLIKRLREHFEQDFLNADNFYQTQCTVHISLEEYKIEKISYVRSWAEGRRLEPKPDPEQAAAIGAVEGHVQVVARAGSGKTATLVNRALFLQQHCDVAPDGILLLAFNRKAAEEMQERLTEYLQDSIPHVMTFHALAYALVHPNEKILLDNPEGEQSLSRAVQRVIDQHRRANYYNEIRALMMARFRADWERIVLGGYNSTPEDMLRYRRSLIRESLDGKYVKSYSEKVIANFLFEHNVPYRYERSFPWDGINYRPDFTIFTGDNCGVIIEYFGLKGDPDYDAMSEKKRNYWQNKRKWKLLEFSPDDLASKGVDGFYILLKQELEDCEIACSQLSEKEIWKRIKDRAIDRFTAVVRGFIQRCRKLSLTPEQLSERVNNLDCDNDIEERFLNLVQVFYRSYLERLQATGEDDFDGLMQKAAEHVTAGKTVFRYKPDTGDLEQIRSGDLEQIRYVLIDEYQDFSELFHRLMQAVRKQNPHVRFFCVGDDWQAINSFAGSDLRFFQNFEQFFEDSNELLVATNYRSARAIVNVGNALMQGQGISARAHKTMTGKVAIADLGTFEPTLQEEHENFGDNSTHAVLRLVNRSINNDKNVVLLSRTNHLPWYVNYGDQGNRSSKSEFDRFLELVRSHFPTELAKKVTISTVHKYKGLQKDVVIALDAIPRRYPLVHPDWIFTRVFGDSIERVVAEERCLFYVALTRAVEDLFILTEKDNFSPFLEDLERNMKLPRLQWSDYPPIESTTRYITVRVGNQNGRGSEPTVAIKDLLYDNGYRWDAPSKTWWIVRLAEGFTVSELINQSSWSNSADGIVVGVYDYSDNEIALYHVDGGQWSCISGNIRESDD